MREKALGRNAVFVITVLFVALLAGFFFTQEPIPGNRYFAIAGDAANKEPENKLYTEEEFAKHWPWLSSASTNPVFNAKLPVEFDIKSGKNVKWKVQIPMGGAGAPIYWGSNMYVSAANKTKRALYCFDANNGKQKWSTAVKSDKSKGPPTVFEEYVCAGSTPATDGNRIYTIFANGDLMATDMKGKLLWQKDLGIPDNDFGHASSLAIRDNQLIVQWDHSGENCGIYVYDGLTGEQKYKIDREDIGAIWRTPITYHDGTVMQLVTSAEMLTGHNFETGELLWEMHGIEGEIGSSPVMHEGIMYTLVDDMFGALKPENGKVTEVWKTDDLAIPDIPSPVIKGDYVYTLDSGGVFSCLNIKTGELIYEHEFNMEVYASLLMNGDHIYICGLEGDVYVVETGPEFKQVSENKLHVPIHATPVIYRDSLIIRSDKELFSFSL
jgi:outer membrane protein assembly factor BamB